MRTQPHLLCLCLAAIILWPGLSLSAQDRSLGLSLSWSEISATYRKPLEANTYLRITANMDMAGLISGRTNAPGISADAQYLFVITKKTYPSGESLSLLTGPGVSAGYLQNHRGQYGPMAALTGYIGVEYAFSQTPLSLALSFEPTIGVHLGRNPIGRSLDFYKQGLISSLYPHLGLSVHFKNPGAAKCGNTNRPDQVKDSYPRFTYGVEISYLLTLMDYSHFNYISSEGDRRNERGATAHAMSSAQILVHCGVNLSQSLNLSLYAGYGGIYKDEKLMPLSLRLSWYSGKDPMQNRWIAFCSGGIGAGKLSPLSRLAALAQLGGGYRLSLSRIAKMDFLISVLETYTHLRPRENGEYVPAERVRRNESLLTTLTFGIGLTF